MLAALLLSACTLKQKNENWSLPPIPTADQVGALLLPDDIAPVKAPFPIVDFKKPEFPDNNIVLSLSKEDINTHTIQDAIDKLSKQGGGSVTVPKGNWKTGRIILKDNINLHFSDGAVLRFSSEIEEYLPAVFTRIEGVEVMSLGACIYANNATNIAVTGNGRLIGPSEGPVRDKIMTKHLIGDVIDFSSPVSERIVDGKRTPWIFAPMFISPINCKKVYIEGVSLENTAFWNIVPIYCDNVIIRGISVQSVGIPRGDGIDVESSRNVLIEYSTLSCGDDCFTMKSGRGSDGLRVNKATENVVVRYCLAKEGHGAITCGSETAGMIRNLYVHDCVFQDTGMGIRFKTRRPRGGGGDNLIYERIRMNLKGHMVKWDMLGSRTYVGKLADRLPVLEINELTPKYENISISDILVEKADYLIKAIGIPEMPIKNVKIQNIKAKTNNLMLLHDMEDVSFRNMELDTNDSLLYILDSRNMSFQNVHFSSSTQKADVQIDGENSHSISFKSSFNLDN